MSFRNTIIAFTTFLITIAISKSIGSSELGALWSKYAPYMAYFIFGYLIFEHGLLKGISFRITSIAFLISYLLTLCVQIYLKKIGMFHGEGMTWYSSPFIIITSMALFSALSKTNISEHAYRILKPISLNSFGIYLIHLIPMFFMLKIIEGVNLNTIIKASTVCVTVFIFSFIYSLLLSKIPFIKKLVI